MACPVWIAKGTSFVYSQCATSMEANRSVSANATMPVIMPHATIWLAVNEAIEKFWYQAESPLNVEAMVMAKKHKQPYVKLTMMHNGMKLNMPMDDGKHNFIIIFHLLVLI